MSLSRILGNLGTTQLIVVGLLLTTMTLLAVGFTISDELEAETEEFLIAAVKSSAEICSDEIDRTIYQCIIEWQAHCKSQDIAGALNESNELWSRASNRDARIAELDQAWTSLPQGQTNVQMEEILQSGASRHLRDRVASYVDAFQVVMIGEVFLTNAFGVNVGQTARTTDFYQADEGWWQEAWQKGVQVSSPELDLSADMFSIALATRIDNAEGVPLGVLKIVVNFDWIMNILKERAAKQSQGIEFSLLTRRMELLRSTSYKIETADFADLEGSKSERPPERLIILSESQGYQSLKPLDLVVAASRPQSFVYDRVAQTRQHMAMGVALTVFAASLYWLLVAKLLQRRLKRLATASHAIRSGDLSARAGIGGSDQIAILGRDFDAMAVDIESLAGTLKSRSELLAERSRRLTTEMERRERLEQERREIERAMQSSQRMETVGQLASGLAHEINTPSQYLRDNLDFIGSSFKELAQRLPIGPVDEELSYLINEVPKAVEQSLSGLRNISELVSALSTFSNPASAEKEIVDIREIIRNAIIVSRNTWNQHSDLEALIGEAPIEAQCFYGDIAQCMLSLISHSAMSTAQVKDRRRGQITVECLSSATDAIIRVSDNGVELSPEERDLILDPSLGALQAHRSGSQALSMALLSITNQHHGSVEVSTEAEVGTKITVRIPKASGPNKRTQGELNETRSVR